MALVLYAHPFSSYCQKVLIALYENEIAFDFQMLADAADMARLAELWPLQKFPVLTDDGRTLIELTCIIEYLHLHHPGPVRLVPDDPDASLDVRMLDRFFDNYISTPMQKIVGDSTRPADGKDPTGVAEARAMLDAAYRWLDQRMTEREWACGSGLSLADCAAAPVLFYADWAHPIADEFSHARAYRQRLLRRPSFVRAVNEAQPYRHLFPLGAPDRD